MIGISVFRRQLARDQRQLEKDATEERKRKLPSSLVVYLVIAMSLWSNNSMSCVLKNLVNGLSREWTSPRELLASTKQRFN